MGYRFKGFSRSAAKMLNQALLLAGERGHQQAGTAHILLAILRVGNSPAAMLLQQKNITEAKVLGKINQMQGGASRRLTARDFLPEACKALDFAILGSHAARMKEAQSEHILCAILEDSNCTASQWILGFRVDLVELARDCRQLSGQLVLPLPPKPVSNVGRSSKSSDKYGKDLTRLAMEGQLDPVVCRESELERMVEILCRRQKNNPCLVGEPGVGKTALAEALTQRISMG